MYAISAAFQAALKKSHTIVSKAEILSNGAVVAEIATAISGRVTIERNAAIRRRCEVTLADTNGSLVPTSSSSLLAPYGNEIRLYRGIRLSTGDELVPLGTFRISKTKVKDDEGVVITVNGYDRSRSISRGKLSAPYQIAAGTNYGTAIQNMISYVRPGTLFSFATTSATTPLLTFLEGDDPWKRAQEMAEAIGCELFFDPLGTCCLQTVTDAGSPVWTYSEGSTATFLDLDRDLDDEATYNGVIATGEGPTLTVPVRAEAWDANPSSPTYYLGQYGKVPEFYSSPYLLTTAQASAAANARLTKKLGVTESVSFSAIVNPAHDAGDVVSISRSRSGLGTANSIFVLDDVTIPLEAAKAMDVSVRERRSLT